MSIILNDHLKALARDALNMEHYHVVSSFKQGATRSDCLGSFGILLVQAP